MPSVDTALTNPSSTSQVFHPCAKMLVELSKSQDIEAGDGTTSVVVLAGSLLNACSDLLQKGIHPTIIADSFKAAAEKGEEVRGESVRALLCVWSVYALSSTPLRICYCC
jgi:T-complex protein 1 subunit delta